jgi:IS5 family transposase
MDHVTCESQPADHPAGRRTRTNHRIERNYRKERDGDRINALLAAAGFNFNLLIRWLALFLRAFLRVILGKTKMLQIS